MSGAEQTQESETIRMLFCVNFPAMPMIPWAAMPDLVLSHSAYGNLALDVTFFARGL